MGHMVKWGCSVLSGSVTPIFTLSSVSGESLDLLKIFFNILPPLSNSKEQEELMQQLTEFQVQHTLYTIHYCTIHTLYTIHYILHYTLHYYTYTTQYTLYTTHAIHHTFTIHYKLYTIHYIHTVHYTL